MALNSKSCYATDCKVHSGGVTRFPSIVGDQPGYFLLDVLEVLYLIGKGSDDNIDVEIVICANHALHPKHVQANAACSKSFVIQALEYGATCGIAANENSFF